MGGQNSLSQITHSIKQGPVLQRVRSQKSAL